MQKGFTLIELLIVIVIIGLLAAVVIAAINPVEQINKSRDVNLIKDTTDLYRAIDRYRSVTGSFPWSNNPVVGSSISSDVINVLTSSKELRDEFALKKGLLDISVFFDSRGLLKLCFIPASQFYTDLAPTTGEPYNINKICYPQ